MTVRTRMAPSPTGEFHIGGMRTLLFNYAFAKQAGGQFILRLEDTDKKREVAGATERILQIIKAYGLSWDEGPDIGGPHAPYKQSERLAIYQKYALDLVAKRHAYYCFCTEDRLVNLRAEQKAKGLPVTKYDRKCLQLPPHEVTQRLEAGAEHVIRLKIPDNELITYQDLFLGPITVPSAELDDQVLQKSDGYPTYHMAVVVDDHLMEITHILRGVEWLPSTPKHVLLYRYLGWTMPLTGHLPNLKEVGQTKKMSKRTGSVAAIQFLIAGYLPEALLNFIMFLGWNPGTDQEIYTLTEFIKDFSLAKVHKSDLVAFDREKLAWLNGHYLRKLPDDVLLARIQAWASLSNVALGLESLSPTYVLAVLAIVKEKMKTLADFQPLTTYFFAPPTVEPTLLTSFAKAKTKEILEVFKTNFTKLPESQWSKPELDQVAHQTLTAFGYAPKEAFMTLRVAVSGMTATPQLFDVLTVLGKRQTLERLTNSLHSLA